MVPQIFYFKKIVFLFCLFLFVSPAVFAKTVHIGVLAYDGKEHAVKRWQPTADYLSKFLPNHQFKIIALTHEEFEYAINKNQLDFALTNPGHYVQLEVLYGITRITTFISRSKNKPLKQFGSVLFTRSDSPINTLKKLHGKKLAAVNVNAFGGFQLVHDQLLLKDINILKTMEVTWLGFPHSDVVEAVLSGSADAGIIRSGVLEKMANKKLISLSQINILNPKLDNNYPLLHSTPLYPEWPFSKLPNTNDQLAKSVAIALLQMPMQNTAAIKSGGLGWTIPLEYSSVHHVLQRLEVAPYPAKALSLKQLTANYGQWLAVFAVLLFTSFATLWRFFRVNKQLRDMQVASQKHQYQLEDAVQLRTDELRKSNLSLQEEIAHHIKADQSLQNCCEAMQGIHDIFLRDDLTRLQRLNSIIDSVRVHLGTEFGLLSRYQNGQLVARISSPLNPLFSAPISQSLSAQAISSKQVTSSASAKWQCYIANPVFIKGELHSLFEFASTQQYNANQDKPISQELSMKLLNLISLWLTFEIDMLDQENETDSRNSNLQERFNTITKREKDVLALLIRGESTKLMARSLSLSTKTIEMHRANLIRKTQAKSSTELVQLAVLANIFPKIQ